MPIVTVDLAERGTLSFEVADNPGNPALFALGVRKSGSSIFSNVAAAVAKRGGRPVIDIPGSVFQAGGRYEDWDRAAVLDPIVKPGNLYIGFRDAPTALFANPVFRAGRKILLVRDPRDALVSEYFSNAYSHSLPRAGTGSVIAVERERALQATLEAYVLGRIEPLNRTIERYAPLLGDPTLLVQRYEEVILAKREWIGRIAGFYGIELPAPFIELVLSWADVRPDVEVPTNFVRRVTPGDHREKLSAETIAAIDRQLSPVWARLGY